MCSFHASQLLWRSSTIWIFLNTGRSLDFAIVVDHAFKRDEIVKILGRRGSVESGARDSLTCGRLLNFHCQATRELFEPGS